MAGYFIIVHGTKSTPIGGNKELGNGRILFNSADASGVEPLPLHTKVFCREGDELTVMASKGMKCSRGHPVKDGSTVYDLGDGKFVCPPHLNSIPTLESLKQTYSAGFYSGITFEVMKKG